jgi:hypothetical protein
VKYIFRGVKQMVARFKRFFLGFPCHLGRE